MENEEAAEKVTEEAAVEAERAQQQMDAARKLVGFIVAAVLIFLAQRDLRKRPPELVRGPVGLWRALAMMPPGAVAYLVVGRRRAVAEVANGFADSVAA